MRPTLYEFAGGADAFPPFAAALHARCLADPELNHPFSHPGQNPQHVERLAAYLAEAMGGPPSYSGECGGDQSALLLLHAGNGDMSDLGRRFQGGLFDDRRRRIGGGFARDGAFAAFGGALLGLLAGLGLVGIVAMLPFGQALGGQEAGDTVGGLGALADPVLQPLDLQRHPLRVVLLQERIVGPHLFDETAIARRMAVGHHDGIIGPLLGAPAGQPDLEH